MVDFKASHEDWECIDWSAKQGGYIPRALVELKQRVKALEDANEARNIEIIKLTNACAHSAADRAQFHADTTADEDDGLDSSKPTSNPSQIRSLLMERVDDAIASAEEKCMTPHWAPEARAAIREMAQWMREQGDYPHGWVAQMLEQEADRG